MKIKALTICQPYAHLIAIGEKRVENRTWTTNYRGPLAIHAGLSRKYLDDGDQVRYPGMAFGAVVATAMLVECVRMDAVADLIVNKPELLWLSGHVHVEGPMCWILEDIQRLETPYPISGQRSLWQIDGWTGP